jgi:hypothetical protein
MTSTEEPRFAGYVLRGGTAEATIVRGGPLPSFVQLRWDDGTADVYKPTGQPDSERSDFERYDLEPLKA